jgi:hypothetical protein
MGRINVSHLLQLQQSNETDPAKVWSVDDDQGHDDMDHSAMPSTKMNYLDARPKKSLRVLERLIRIGWGLRYQPRV